MTVEIWILTWISWLSDGHEFLWTSLLIRSSMKDDDDRILLTAPPRFGKTMACNMLEMFFEIVNSEQQKLKKYKLFKDLKIYKCAEECTDDHDCESKRFFRQHCGQHPVISLDFAQLSSQSYSKLLGSLRDVITMQFKKYMCLIHKDGEKYKWSSNNMGYLDVNEFLNYLKTADEDSYWNTAADSQKGQYVFGAFTYLLSVRINLFDLKQQESFLNALKSLGWLYKFSTDFLKVTYFIGREICYF